MDRPVILMYDPTPADDTDTVNTVMNTTLVLNNAECKQPDADTLLTPIILESSLMEEQHSSDPLPLEDCSGDHIVVTDMDSDHIDNICDGDDDSTNSSHEWPFFSVLVVRELKHWKLP